MSWKLDSSHAVSADGTQCDRCGVVAREFAATMPCLYEPIDPTSPAALPVSEEPRQSCYEKHGERCVYINPQTRRCEECGASAEEPRREEPDRDAVIEAARTLVEEPWRAYLFEQGPWAVMRDLLALVDQRASSSAVVVGADQQLKEAINKLNVVIQSLHELERRPDDRDANSVWTWRLDVVADELIAIRDALFNAPALPDPGLPERIWCTGCKAIRPLLRDPLGYGVTDLVCGQCHLIAATLHPPEREK
jgi:hypothetical protein